MNSSTDPRRPDKEIRYKPPGSNNQAHMQDDMTPEYMNVIGMIFSMCGLMMRLKWCSWVALYCSCISFANTRVSEDAKQILSCFMLSISAVVMSYLQNPQPMIPPWASAMQWIFLQIYMFCLAYFDNNPSLSHTRMQESLNIWWNNIYWLNIWWNEWLLFILYREKL